MNQDLSQIVKLRKKLGLTQTKLAELSGVSQSLIAKIESGRVDPAYSKVKQILEALEHERGRKGSKKKAHHIMTQHIIYVAPDEKLGRAIDLMKRKNISQIPVMNGHVCVGSIAENTIVESIAEYGNRITDVPVNEVMDETFPSIPADSDLEALTSLLRYYKAVLVKRKGNIVGIITKADLLKAIE